VPQLADLFCVLPHDDMMEMMSLLPPEQAARIRPILTEREATARALMSTAYLAMGKDATVGHVLGTLRSSGREYHGISYIYVVSGPENALLGVADLRQVVLSPEHLTLADIMAAPVVAAEEDDTRSDLEDLFARYHYRMIPVVDAQDHLVGIIHHNDIMKGISSYSRT
jgi:magnesium transporter